MKATAQAFPIQGLVKYHGLIDEELRLPYHDSISVCTGPIRTITTVEPFDKTEDSVTVDGKELSGRPLERVVSVLDRVRKRAEKEVFFNVVSKNDFPSNIGLGASSSAFAALAYAACASLELGLGRKEVSRIARIGAGSAARSVTGGISHWFAGSNDKESFSIRLDDNIQIGMLAVVVPAYKETENAHRAVLSSPFFKARLDYIPGMIEQMTGAVKKKDIPEIGRLAEMDTLNLHGITMTSLEEMVLWQPETIRVIQLVKRMRSEGTQVYFSIDTGATVYINTLPELLGEVSDRFEEEGFDIRILQVAGGAELINEHLF